MALLLLDTNALIWFVNDDPALGSQAGSAILNGLDPD